MWESWKVLPKRRSGVWRRITQRKITQRGNHACKGPGLGETEARIAQGVEDVGTQCGSQNDGQGWGSQTSEVVTDSWDQERPLKGSQHQICYNTLLEKTSSSGFCVADALKGSRSRC